MASRGSEVAWGPLRPVLVVLALIAGCGQNPTGIDNTVGEVLGTQTTSGNLINPDGATPVEFNQDGAVLLIGAIEDNADVDVYDLGPCAAGDNYQADATQSGGLDSVIALFDADSNLMMLNDDSFAFQSPSSPSLNLTARWATDHLYLVVAKSPKNSSTGEYTVSVIRTQIGSPPPAPAVVLLDWNGASGVSVGGSLPVNVPAFDGAFIHSSFGDDTQAIIDSTVAFIRQDFANLNVAFYVDGQAGIPPGPKSIIYFGTYSPTLLGLADTVDYYNGVLSQEAIIYTDAFSLFMPLAPSVSEIAQSMANVASHEIGHLLGLNHTQDPLGVMDITATAYQLLQDEAIRRSPLNASVFSTGFQNGVSLLVATVGGTASALDIPSMDDLALKLQDPREAARAILGSVRIRKDLFTAHQCSVHTD